MILCPFCHFQNEDGALFCEQCKSDLSGVPEMNSPTSAPPPAAETVAPVAPPPEKKPEPPPPPKAEEAPPKKPEPPPPPKVEPAPPEMVLPRGAEPRLLVLRGQRRNVEYPIYEGLNFIG